MSYQKDRLKTSQSHDTTLTFLILKITLSAVFSSGHLDYFCCCSTPAQYILWVHLMLFKEASKPQLMQFRPVAPSIFSCVGSRQRCPRWTWLWNGGWVGYANTYTQRHTHEWDGVYRGLWWAGLTHVCPRSEHGSSDLSIKLEQWLPLWYRFTLYHPLWKLMLFSHEHKFSHMREVSHDFSLPINPRTYCMPRERPSCFQPFDSLFFAPKVSYSCNKKKVLSLPKLVEQTSLRVIKEAL